MSDKHKDAQGELPELPTAQPYVRVWFSTEAEKESLQNANQAYFTADQMHEYARTTLARRASQVSAAAPVEPFDTDEWEHDVNDWMGKHNIELRHTAYRTLVDIGNKFAAKFVSPLRASEGQAQTSAVVGRGEEDRSNWTFKQWYEHVGAWETPEGFISFGSPMALRAMLIQYARAALKAQPARTEAQAMAFGKPFDPKDETIKKLQGLIKAYQQIIAGHESREKRAIKYANSAQIAKTEAQGEDSARLDAADLATIEEATKVLESAAKHNEGLGRTVFAHVQRDRAARLRAILNRAAPQPQEKK